MSCRYNLIAERAKVISPSTHALDSIALLNFVHLEIVLLNLVTYGPIDNLRNGMVVLEYTLLRLRHEQDAFRTNQEKSHLFFCTACCWRVQVSCHSVTLQYTNTITTHVVCFTLRNGVGTTFFYTGILLCPWEK